VASAIREFPDYSWSSLTILSHRPDRKNLAPVRNT
jgi:hypothetical protein